MTPKIFNVIGYRKETYPNSLKERPSRQLNLNNGFDKKTM